MDDLTEIGAVADVRDLLSEALEPTVSLTFALGALGELARIYNREKPMPCGITPALCQTRTHQGSSSSRSGSL